MANLTFDDMHRALGFLPKDIIKMMKAHPIFLAGGYIRAHIAGEDATDIDLFGETKEACDTFASALAADRNVTPYRTRNAFTIIAPPRVPVQFIHRWTFSEAAALIESFDFTVARACIWFDRKAGAWQSAADPQFYPDLAARRLRYCFPVRNEDAGGSLLRVQKFIKRGYDISPEQFANVIARLLGGVREESGFWSSSEDASGKVLAGLLRQVDPMTIIDGLHPSDDSMEEPSAPETVALNLPSYEP